MTVRARSGVGVAFFLPGSGDPACRRSGEVTAGSLKPLAFVLAAAFVRLSTFTGTGLGVWTTAARFLSSPMSGVIDRIGAGVGQWKRLLGGTGTCESSAAM